MAHELLWAPWRMAYVAAEKPEAASCIFCELPARGERRDDLVLRADEHAVVMLNRYPYGSGHLMIAPRRHTADLGALDAPAWSGLMEALRGAVRAVERAMRCDGVNAGANLGRVAGAGIAEHLHWHVVPRWLGDTNFMPVIADVKVMPQYLAETYDLLRPHFA